MKRLQLLLIEENPLGFRLLRTTLARLNGNRPHLTRVATLPQALELLANSPFDAVLLDLSLAGGQGLAELERLHVVELDVFLHQPVQLLAGVEEVRQGLVP